MANEIKLSYRTGATLTYGAYQTDGTVRTAAGTSLPEIAGTGYYTATDGNVVVGDNVVIKEGANVVAGGLYELPDVADAVWDEILTGATHNINNSAGRKLRNVSSAVIITGTSPNTGGTTNTSILIELNGDASEDNGAYDPAVISIVAGTGAGQTRQIWEYLGGVGGDGVTKLVYVNRDWKVTPDNTSEYVITGNPGFTHVNEGLARGGSANTITLNTLAASDPIDYIGQIVFVAAGVGADQVRIVNDYDGTTKIATVDRNWGTQPTSGSMYAILPVVGIAADSIADAVLRELIADHSGVSGSLAQFIELIKDILESDELLNVDDAAQWLVQMFKKGTSTEIMRKNLFDNTGASITATSQVVGARTHTASP